MNPIQPQVRQKLQFGQGRDICILWHGAVENALAGVLEGNAFQLAKTGWQTFLAPSS